jgi:glycosyltransferase involved in cell wall biosynthesis
LLCANVFPVQPYPNGRAAALWNMRVLFDHPYPFALAHGGFQIQIEQTALALRSVGVQVDHMRWWDDRQEGDILHYFGRPQQHYLTLARQKGLKVIVADLLTELGSRSLSARRTQKWVMQVLKRTLPGSFLSRLAWDTYREADAAVALTAWEAQLLQEMFDVPRQQIHVVPNGVEPIFLESPPRERGPWLVCTATVTERKRVLELAEAAVLAQAPVWIIGKPYSPQDPYGQRFEALARANPKWIRYEGAIRDRARLAEVYRSARGFVLLSAMESLSLSALEASACECPLLLSDLPWARTTFGERANYCPIGPASRTAGVLGEFYQRAPSLSPPPKPLTWKEIAAQFKGVYETVLAGPR